MPNPRDVAATAAGGGTAAINNDRRASGTRAVNRLIAGFAFFSALNAAFNANMLGNISSSSSYANPSNGYSYESGLTLPRMDERGSRGTSSKDNVVCPDVWGYFYDERNGTHGRSYLEDLHRTLVAYHNLGGNYDALSSFMSRSVDATYDAVGLSDFVSDRDADRKVAGGDIQEFIRSELRRQDKDNRGGYYQRKFPGKFEGVDVGDRRYKKLLDNGRSITSVMEPVTNERWDIAIGPTLEERSCRGFQMIGKEKTDSVKCVCGWDRLSNGTGNPAGGHGDGVRGGEGSPLTSSPPSSCNVISIGSNDQWAFESDIVRHTSCTVHTFDCTVTKPKNKPLTNRVRFHKVCITGDPDLPDDSTINGRKFMTYFDMLELVGLTTASSVTYLKMDIEGYEWEVFMSMVREAKARNLRHLLPQQIMVELHYATWMYDLRWAMRAIQTGELMTIFSMLFREAGYVVAFKEKNYWAMIREVLLVKVYC